MVKFTRHLHLRDMVSRVLDRAYADALAMLRDNLEALSVVANRALVDSLVANETLHDPLLYCRTTPKEPLS